MADSTNADFSSTTSTVDRPAANSRTSSRSIGLIMPRRSRRMPARRSPSSSRPRSRNACRTSVNALPPATMPSQASGASTSTVLIGLAARNARTIAQRGPYICASAVSDSGGASIGYCR